MRKLTEHLTTLIRAARLAQSHAGGLAPLLRRLARILQTEGPRGLWLKTAFFRGLAAPADASAAPFLPRGATRADPDARVMPHQATVDIVVCVHDALEDVRACLHSLIAWTTPPYRLILVDDGSATETARFLDDFLIGQPGLLLRHPEALGYTLAANRGLRVSTAEFVVLLNSDTLVTAGWLDRLVAAAQSAPDIGLVGPLSNTASWQSVPDLFDEQGDWATNPSPAGLDLPRLGALVAATSVRQYPCVGFLNGFCLLLKRALIEALGPFDEAGFGAGFGEENDYCLRARQAGWQLAVADDVYIHHAQSKSYGTARRQALAQRADQTLRAKHGDLAILRGLAHTRDHAALAAIRARVRRAPQRIADRERIRQWHEGRRILFLLPIASPSGGANVVLREAETLIQAGVDAEIANLHAFRDAFQRAYDRLRVPVRFIDPQTAFPALAADYDAVIATVYSSLRWLDPLEHEERSGTAAPTIGYYAQDFEPWFFDARDPRAAEALASYRRPGIRLFTKTQWTRQTIREFTGVDATVIGPSLDLDRMFPPSLPRDLAPVRVSAMVRPSTRRRGPERTLMVIAELLRRRPRLTVEVFGVDTPDDPLLRQLREVDRCTIHGVLRPFELRALLGRSHLFLDLSDFQAMGLTCMEAMACGAAVIGPQRGGLAEIVRHDESGVLVDTADADRCVSAALRLIDDPPTRTRLAARALEEIAGYYPERAALNLMERLFPDPPARHRDNGRDTRP